jgi:hypothetical protein
MEAAGLNGPDSNGCRSIISPVEADRRSDGNAALSQMKVAHNRFWWDWLTGEMI